MTISGAAMLPNVDFRSIRAYGSPASCASAFEELVSLLLREGLLGCPDGTVYTRFSNPDGGREGRAELPDGQVWAWQAKYLFAFGDDEIAQVDRSVRRVLVTETALTRYVIALPYDLPAGDTDGSPGTRRATSAYTKWRTKKAAWEELAVKRGMSVDFIYVGAHELVAELTRPEQSGRLRYWFNASALSPEQNRRHLEDAIAKAGRRYTPQAHVEVAAVAALQGLGRVDEYLDTIRQALADVRRARGSSWRAPQDDEEVFADTIPACLDALAALDSAVGQLKSAAEGHGPLPSITAEIGQTKKALETVHRLLSSRHLTESGYYVNDAASLFDSVRKAEDSVWAVEGLLASPATAAADRGQLLVIGRAGVGKTHLFCDVASRRVAAGQPTVLILGQDFDGRRLPLQLGELAGLSGSVDEVLAVLDAAGEAAGCRAMIMIDALNEATNAERWTDELRVLAEAVGRHPHVTLAASCRVEFVGQVVGEAHGLPRVPHDGFGEATREAIDRYTNEYGLDRLAFPVLNPEYSNPLFLKLTCEALSTLGATQFPLGRTGLTTVCNAFLDAVNKRLSASVRCDYDESRSLVRAAVRALAEQGPGPYDRDVVSTITESLHGPSPWSRSLLLGLLREGVLTDTFNNQVTWAYQRLGDVARASLLSEMSAEDLCAWFDDLGDEAWAERGTLGALAVLVPETLKVEVLDLLRNPGTGMVTYDSVDAFVESLVLRSPEHTSDRTVELVEQLLGTPRWTDAVWEQLVRVSCVDGHRTNAGWLHKHLSATSLPQRDATWSEWLVGATERPGDGSVTGLLDWFWHPETGSTDSSPLPHEVGRLASLAISWMFTSADRRVRDRATKALVASAERCPDGFAAAVRQFRSCNDPYVVERVAAALCAVALRTSEPDVRLDLAGAAQDLVAGHWPGHLLTRDYLRRVADAARESGLTGPDWSPPYDTTWPPATISERDLQPLVEDVKHRYSAVWGSVHGFGDFGRYVIEPALSHLDHPDEAGLRSIAERAIFQRVLDLGWTPELLGKLESRGGRHDSPVERYSKKYQWIAFYETLGILTDHWPLRDRWNETVPPFRYSHAEQLVYRDIDPTVLTPGGRSPVDDATAWVCPVQARFPSQVPDGYPQDLDGVPDPLDLIALTSPTDGPWLSLMRYDSWTQPLPAEVQALDPPTLDIWMQVRGYLVRLEDATAIRTWAHGRDWDGRWMPENAEVHSVLLSAHPRSPDWDAADGASDGGRGRGEPPVELLQPTAWYAGTGTSRESAAAHEPTGFVPSQRLFDLLGLQPGRDFNWHDDRGLAVVDPTVTVGGTSTLLLRRDLIYRLGEHGYGVFWTVLSNKQLIRRDYTQLDPDYTHLSLSAAYLGIGAAVECVSATAWLRRPGVGPTGGDAVTWNVRSSG